MSKWTKEEDKYLVENYLTEDISKICEYLNRSESSVIQRATGNLGVTKRGLPKNVTIDDLIRKYEDLQSTRKVGKVFGIHNSKVGYYLKKAGVSNKPIRYTWNDYYFSQNTAEVFYWAGFIAADGCVKLKDNKYKRLSICLAQKDHSHLEKFKAAAGFNGPIHKIVSNGNKSSQMAISSAQMFDDLVRFNIVPRKSLIYTFPEWLIDHPLVNHFMRGYNDGDGSFYRSVNRKTGRTVEQLYFSVRGTKKFLSVFNTILETNCEFKKHKEPRLSNGIYCLEFGGTRKVGKIRDFLYKNSTPKMRLDRKYEVAHDDIFINIPKNYKERKVIGTNIETGEELILNSMKDGEQFGFLRQAISACCRGKSPYHKGYIWHYADEELKTDINNTVIRKHTSWSEEDIRYLKTYYSIVDTTKISAKLNFDISTIRSKAGKLGLKKSKKATTARAIIGKHKNNGKVIRFDSIKAALEYGFCKPHLHRALSGKSKYHKGYIWRYA